jgi:hypothetical protein
VTVDLSDFTDSLRREIAPPGSTVFATATDTELVGYLADGFWEARLDGFLEGFEADGDGVVTPTAEGGEDMDRKNVALVVLYAGLRILRNQILNTNTGFRAKAGSVEFERQNSATMLAEMLRQLQATKNRILEQAEFAETGVSVWDAFSTRLFEPGSYFGSVELAG